MSDADEPEVTLGGQKPNGRISTGTVYPRSVFDAPPPRFIALHPPVEDTCAVHVEAHEAAGLLAPPCKTSLSIMMHRDDTCKQRS
jgi:hypothetical protein